MFLTLLFRNKFRLPKVAFCGVWGGEKLKSEKYREYAHDCIRLAEHMSAADKQTLLKIAEAWETRALEAEREEKRKA